MSLDTTAEAGVKPAFRAGGRLKPDVKAGLAILCFSAIAFAATFTFESIPDGLIQGPGAAMFPRLVIGVIATLSLILIWRGRVEAFEPVEPIHPMTVITLLTQVAFMGLTAIIGMIAALFVALVALGKLWGAPRWAPLLTVSAVTMGLVYGLFVKVFNIPIPLGMLGTLLG